MVRLAFSIAAGLLLTSAAQASSSSSRPACMITVVAPTHATENSKATMAKGTSWGPATQMRTDLADGRVSYCAHGDCCYPADHLRFVTPCTPDASPVAAVGRDADRTYGLHG